jgi:hypothetical protein
MCLGGGGDAGSSSTSSGSASANVTFNPTITIGSNRGDVAQDTPSTFAAALLAAPTVRVNDPAPAKRDEAEDPQRKILIFVAVALAAKKVLRG